MRQYVIFSNMILFNISVKMIGMKNVKLVKKKCICTNFDQFKALSWPYLYRFMFFLRKAYLFHRFRSFNQLR